MLKSTDALEENNRHRPVLYLNKCSAAKRVAPGDFNDWFTQWCSCRSDHFDGRNSRQERSLRWVRSFFGALDGWMVEQEFFENGKTRADRARLDPQRPMHASVL
jgi:hypothetical protein